MLHRQDLGSTNIWPPSSTRDYRPSEQVTFPRGVSSGDIIPARASALMDIMQIAILASMLRPRIAEPQNSMTPPTPPAVPMTPIARRMMSLLLTPGSSNPSTCILIFWLCFVNRVCVANTCSTSLMPIPHAMAPEAPWVEVWLSPQKIVVPGRVKPYRASWYVRCPDVCLQAQNKLDRIPWRHPRA